LHLQNWEDSANIWQMCTIHTVMSTDSTVLLLFTKTKQENQCNEASRPLKKSSALFHIKYGKVSLQIEFATLPPKPQPLCEMRMKRKMEKQGKCGHRLIVHSITRRGEIWKGEGGCEVKRQWGGRGGGGSFVPTYKRAGWNGMTIHILFNSY
jgi:hypothetical protein